MDVLRPVLVGMIRDAGNVVAGIAALSELAKKSLEARDWEGVGRDLDALRVAAFRGSVLTRKMLALGWPSLVPVTVDLNEILGRAARNIRVGLPPEVGVRVECGDPPPVRADGPAVCAALAMLVGGRVVLRDGDSLSLSTGLATWTEADVRRQGWGRPGRYGVITVSIVREREPENPIPHGLESPPTDEGAGLDPSLLLLEALMKQHRGYLDLTSGMFRWTEARLFFHPAAFASEDFL